MSMKTTEERDARGGSDPAVGIETAKIVGLAILLAVAYGVGHDQVTARICVEYFTIGHPPIFSTENPTLLAFGWGIVATWWVGLILGCLLAAAARIGEWPRMQASELVRPLLCVLVTVGLLAAVAGIAGYFAASLSLGSSGAPARSDEER